MTQQKQFNTCQQWKIDFPDLFSEILGNPSYAVSGVTSPDLADESNAVFISNPKYLNAACLSRAQVIVISPKLKNQALSLSPTKTYLITDQVELAMARVINKYYLSTPFRSRSLSGIHPMAFVSPSAKVAKSATISPNAFVGDHVVIEDDVFVGASAYLEEHTIVRKGTTIHPLVYIGHHTEIGAECEIHPNSTIGKEGFGYAHTRNGEHIKIAHQGRVVLEDKVHVGANCCIDRGTMGETRIGKGTIFDNQCHVAHNCEIGEHGILTARFAVAGSSKIGKHFVAGGSSLVTGHIVIGDQVHLGGLSAVTKSISEPGQYGGNPLVSLQQHIKTKAALAHLPEMRSQVRRLLKAVFADETSTSAEE